ncbi:MAG: GntR family transcriptional regulator [Planctomycetota bacterium]
MSLLTPSGPIHAPNIAPKTPAEAYARYLKRSIFEGHWRCGSPLSEAALLEKLLKKHYRTQLRADLDRLPPERGRRSADEFSRRPLREALTILSGRRLIERSSGGSARPRRLTSKDREQIFDARRMIEPNRAKKAAFACRSSPIARQRMEEVWSCLDFALDGPGGAGSYIEVDIAFHTEIARLSSEVLALLVEITLEQTVVGGRRASEVTTYLRQQHQTKDRGAGIHAEHQAIYQAIVDGDEARAEAEMERHLDAAEDQNKEVAFLLDL